MLYFMFCVTLNLAFLWTRVWKDLGLGIGNSLVLFLFQGDWSPVQLARVCGEFQMSTKQRNEPGKQMRGVVRTPCDWSTEIREQLLLL